MAEKREFILNSVLLVIMVALVGYLVYDVRQSRADLREVAEAGDNVIANVILRRVTPRPVQPFASSLFEDNNHFDPIVTPLPSRTPPPKPTPTQTPLPTPNWQVVSIMGPVVQIRDKFGKFHYMRAGEELEKFQIVRTDQENNRILYRSLEFGNEGWLSLNDERKPKGGVSRKPRTSR